MLTIRPLIASCMCHNLFMPVVKSCLDCLLSLFLCLPCLYALCMQVWCDYKEVFCIWPWFRRAELTPVATLQRLCLSKCMGAYSIYRSKLGSFLCTVTEFRRTT